MLLNRKLNQYLEGKLMTKTPQQAGEVQLRTQRIETVGDLRRFIDEVGDDVRVIQPFYVELVRREYEPTYRRVTHEVVKVRHDPPSTSWIF